ncbi:hypothetical protein JTE90_024615 [Oedothorax gibbosus]|uniref:Lipase domain-containing protein n=1 Tax=Oedothorax gibbosus TaxID=931172 RepID=A0AAV6UEQ1_9ARAC|nr:hypothetical protein JTE90_024615 [Oedothorax gibbosus]
MRCGIFLCVIWGFCELGCILAAGNATSLLGRLQRNPLAPLRTHKEVCYADLGCFNTGPPFYHPLYRPISVSPLRPEVQGTTFRLYSRGNKDTALVFTPAELGTAGIEKHFDPDKWTRILVHGVFDGVKLSTWMRDVKDTLLTLEDENVFLVDHGSKVPPFFLNAANARVIGAQIAMLVDFLQKNFGALQENFHIIGHSLGAHIAGYAGERLKRLGRITGLDPIGPYFRNVPNNVKLDPSDALFVDVIHTNPGRNILEGLGTIEDVGHVNFWPSGGKPRGCSASPLRALTTGIFPSEFLQNTFLCRHFRAPDFFRSSFHQHGCLFVGAECGSWEEFALGRCGCGTDGQKCRLMGQHSTPAMFETRYHLQVGRERPYCLHQYQVILYLEIPQRKTYGSVSILLDIFVDAGKGFRETRRFSVNLMEDRQFKTFLLTFQHPIGKVYSVATALHVMQRRSTVDVSLEAIEINYLFPLPKKEVSSLLCKESEEPLHRGKQTLLTQRACKALIAEFRNVATASNPFNSTSV